MYVLPKSLIHEQESFVQQQQGALGYEDEIGPNTQQIEQWAEKERANRRAWLEGPTDAEKAMWRDMERAKRTGNSASPPSHGSLAAYPDLNFAVMGLLSMLLRPISWQRLVEEGRNYQYPGTPSGSQRVVRPGDR